MRPGQLGLLIARSEVGKSALAGQIAVNAAAQGFSSVFASLEMSREELTVRFLSSYMDRPVTEIESALTSNSFDPGLVEAGKVLKRVSIDDSTEPSWDDMASWVAQCEATIGERPRLVIVDHLRLMARYGYPRGEVERVRQLAAHAKKWAKDQDVALLMLHQVGRSGGVFEEDTEKVNKWTKQRQRKNYGDLPLTKEDCEYGGEQDADYVFALYRPEMNPTLTPQAKARWEGFMVLQLVKNRHGAPNHEGVLLEWKRPSMRIREVESLSTYMEKEDLAAMLGQEEERDGYGF